MSQVPGRISIAIMFMPEAEEKRLIGTAAGYGCGTTFTCGCIMETPIWICG